MFFSKLVISPLSLPIKLWVNRESLEATAAARPAPLPQTGELAVVSGEDQEGEKTSWRPTPSNSEH